MMRLAVTIINIGIVPRINWRIAKPSKAQCRMGIARSCSTSLTRGIGPSSTITYISLFLEINSNREVF